MVIIFFASIFVFLNCLSVNGMTEEKTRTPKLGSTEKSVSFSDLKAAARPALDRSTSLKTLRASLDSAAPEISALEDDAQDEMLCSLQKGRAISVDDQHFFAACKRNDLATAALVFARNQASAKIAGNSSKRTPLHLAVELNNDPLVAFILAQGGGRKCRKIA